MERIEQLDRQISLWINSFHCPATDGFWVFMSEKFVWIPLYVLIAALMIWRFGWKRGLIAIACIALAFFFDERVNNLIKGIVQRVRPCNDEGMLALGIHVLETGGGWSFPSGHSCNVFGLAMSSSLCLLAPRKPMLDEGVIKMTPALPERWRKLYTAFIFIWAALVGLSRIMVARHFFGDVIVGAALGCTIGLIWGLISVAFCTRKVTNL